MGLLNSHVSTHRLQELIRPFRERGTARMFMYPAAPYLAHLLAQTWNTELFALTVNNTEADSLRAMMPAARVMCASLADARITHGSMSVAVVELPAPDPKMADDAWGYDDATPIAVLRRAALTLVPNGILVATMPIAGFTQRFWRTLTTWFDIVGTERLKDRDADVGVAVVGTLRPSFASTTPPAFPRLDKMSEAGLPARIGPLPAAPGKRVEFIATGFTYPQAMTEGRQHGVWTDPVTTARLVPDVEWTVRPLMPLARGHLGQLIACGAFNNALLQGPDGPVLLKGQTHKLRRETEKDKHVTTMRDQFQTTVTLLHLRTGQLEIVETGEDNAN
ncbi:MAG TPA: hypothetical protein VEP50_21100 [bacterium]|nr:hypothetical protein [bacterium]